MGDDHLVPNIRQLERRSDLAFGPTTCCCGREAPGCRPLEAQLLEEMLWRPCFHRRQEIAQLKAQRRRAERERAKAVHDKILAGTPSIFLGPLVDLGLDPLALDLRGHGRAVLWLTRSGQPSL